MELTRRGIKHSMSSKNLFFADSKACLEINGIRGYFVFPKIDWQPKGQLIASIIEDMRLRGEGAYKPWLKTEQCRFQAAEEGAPLAILKKT